MAMNIKISLEQADYLAVGKYTFDHLQSVFNQARYVI